MFQLIVTTTMELRILEVRKERNHTAVAIRSIIKHTGEVLALRKIFVEVAFGKRLYCMPKSILKHR